MPWRLFRWQEVQLLLFLNHGSGGEWSASRPGRTLPPGKEPPVPFVHIILLNIFLSFMSVSSNELSYLEVFRIQIFMRFSFQTQPFEYKSDTLLFCPLVRSLSCSLTNLTIIAVFVWSDMLTTRKRVEVANPCIPLVLLSEAPYCGSGEDLVSACSRLCTSLFTSEASQVPN
jgi:hypothetical protein